MFVFLHFKHHIKAGVNATSVCVQEQLHNACVNIDLNRRNTFLVSQHRFNHQCQKEMILFVGFCYHGVILYSKTAKLDVL